METKKIAIGCFVGGVLCVAVALMCAPMFWWLGLLAGMAGGYLGYEFREVLWAIPIAWRKSRRSVSTWWTETDKKVRGWSLDPHPLFYYWITTITIMIWGCMIYKIFSSETELNLGNSFLFMILLVEFNIVPSLFVLLLTLIFALIGARVGEKCFWFPFSMLDDKSQESEAKKLEKEGYRKEVLTGKNFFRWIMKGVGLTILFFVWTAWKYLFIGIGLLLCFWGRSGWEFFKLIHSKKRVLCAIDGTIGGTVVFFCFGSTPLIFSQQILVVFFGGLLGAVIGVLNYEIVSKRILHLVPAVNNI